MNGKLFLRLNMDCIRLVMSFNLTTTPSIFMILMNHSLHAFIGIFIVVYFDDILVYSKSLNEHIKHLHFMLNVFQERNIIC